MVCGSGALLWVACDGHSATQVPCEIDIGVPDRLQLPKMMRLAREEHPTKIDEAIVLGLRQEFDPLTVFVQFSI